jgi:hypothetical protein
MERVRSFDSVPVDAIQAYLASNTETGFATSELYSSEHQTKSLDSTQPKSVFRHLKDKEIFRLVQDVVVDMLNKTDKYYSYLLHKDDITEIKYKKGDYL